MASWMWGAGKGALIDMEWQTGDQIWRVGDRVDHTGIPNGIGIVIDVVTRQRLPDGKVRTTYAVEFLWM